MATPATIGSLHLGEALPPVLAMAGWWLAYRLRCRTLARRGRPVPRWRQACFAAGALLIIAALAPPADRLGDQLLAVHMAQHLVLGDVAALLVALSLSGAVLGPLLRRRSPGGLRWVSHPLVAFPVWAIDLYVWHVPGLYQLAQRDDLVHALQHVMFFGLGLNMWMPLFGALPLPEWFGQGARLGYVVAVRLAGMVLANVLIFSGSLLYPRYAAGEARHGVGALTDQRIAGSIMMIEGMVIAIALFTWLFFRWDAQTERRQSLVDLAAERGLELPESRAARAVASGQDEALRHRVSRRSHGS